MLWSDGYLRNYNQLQKAPQFTLLGSCFLEYTLAPRLFQHLNPSDNIWPADQPQWFLPTSFLIMLRSLVFLLYITLGAPLFERNTSRFLPNHITSPRALWSVYPLLYHLGRFHLPQKHPQGTQQTILWTDLSFFTRSIFVLSSNWTWSPVSM